MVFVCHVTLKDDVSKALYEFMIRSLSRYITILASFVTIIDTAVGGGGRRSFYLYR